MFPTGSNQTIKLPLSDPIKPVGRLRNLMKVKDDFIAFLKNMNYSSFEKSAIRIHSFEKRGSAAI